MPFLEDDELNFLSSVLAACKLSLADIAIVNKTPMDPLNYREITNQLKSTKCITFWMLRQQTMDLPFNFPHFQLQQFDQCTYLSAPALKNIEN